jgi:hypothetical protein
MDGENVNEDRLHTACRQLGRRIDEVLIYVFDSEGQMGTTYQQVLLPPIELQPPSPPRTIAWSSVESMTATPKGKVKGPANNTWSLASALTTFDFRLELSPGF